MMWYNLIFTTDGDEYYDLEKRFWDVQRLSTHVKEVKLTAARQQYTLGLSFKHSAVVNHKAHRSSNAELLDI